MEKLSRVYTFKHLRVYKKACKCQWVISPNGSDSIYADARLAKHLSLSLAKSQFTKFVVVDFLAGS